MEIKVHHDYDFPAERVWELLGNFGDISWAPGMDKVEVFGEGVGMTRRIFMPGMDPVDEVLESMDHENMTFTYTIPSGIPMPVTDYRAGGKVLSTGNGSCRVEWHASATPEGVSEEEAAEMMKGFLGMLLQWLDDHLQQSG